MRFFGRAPEERDKDYYVLTFPNGDKVGPGELSAWLAMVEEDCDDEAAVETARAIVRGIRSKMN